MASTLWPALKFIGNRLFGGGVTDTDYDYSYGNYSYIYPAYAQDYYDTVMANQQAIWDREDSAHQREVADLKAAGLNPWLSASGGGSGAPTSSGNGAESALNSLIQLLSLNNSAINLKTKDEQWAVNTVLDTALKTLMPAAKSFS